MTSPTVSAGHAGPLASTATPGTDPAHRGGLVIHDRVVEKVAAHAVRQVPSAGGAPRRVLGLARAEAQDDEARVKARVDSGVATVSVTITVQWPTPVTSVAEQVRRRIREDVARITATDVRRIDVEVVSMAVPGREQPRVR